MATLFGILFLPALALANFETEVHWVLCNTTPNKVVERLDANVTKEKERDVSYLDTSSLKWQKAGVTLRVRTSLNKITSTVKISMSPEAVPTKWLHHKDGKCEWDRRGNQKEFICSVDNEVSVESTTSDLFSKDQRAFLKDSSKNVDFDNLKMYGPAKNKHVELEIEEEEFVIERFTRNKKTFLEISQRVPEEESAETDSSFGKKLVRKGIELCPKQISKSDWLLELD